MDINSLLLLFFYCLHSFAFSRMSYTWNNPVYIAFSDWPLSLGNMHLKFLHVFSWLDRLIFFSHWIVSIVGFLGSSAGKEYTCNVGETGSNPGSESSPGEGIGYPLLYSWASLVAQMVKNPPAMQETWVQSLGWDEPLEEGMASHSSILAWRIPMDRGAWQATVHEVAESRTWLSN